MVDLSDDHELIDGLRKGLEDAQVQLLQLYGEPLVRFLQYRFGANVQDAEDVAVETLYRVIERINGFTGSRDDSSHAFRNWVFTIARNKWYDNVRKHKKIAYIDEDDYERLGDSPTPDTFGEPASQVVVLQEALSNLPDKQRLTLSLYYEGRTLTEIADMLDVAPGTVRQWKKRGLEALKKALADHPIFADRLES